MRAGALNPAKGMVAVLLFALLGCRETAAPAEPEITTDAPPQPKLKLTSSRYDIGSVLEEQDARFSIELSNAGDAVLHVDSVTSSRFCKGAAPEIIAPRQTARLEVTCRADLSGPLRERLVLTTNDPAASSVPFEVVGVVTPLLAFERSVVELTGPSGELSAANVRVTGLREREARLSFEAPHVPDLLVERLSNDVDHGPGLLLRCTGTRPGLHAGTLLVSTGLARPAELTLSWACRIAGTLQISPTNPFFDLKDPGVKQVLVDVRSSQPDFRVSSARAVEGPFTASLERVEEAHYRVRVTVEDERVPLGSRSATGKLVIASNDSSEPLKEIPLSGFGQILRRAASSALP